MAAVPIRAVLDANVLYPSTLRDTLLRAAEAGFFQICWSEEILGETTRSLIRSGRLTERKAAHLLDQMKKAFPDAMVTGHGAIIPALKNQEKDRHVAAAAVRAGARLVVTGNLRDFRNLPEGLVAQSPDDFLRGLFALDEDGMVELLKAQAGAMKKPPVSLSELLTALSKRAPDFVRAVRAHL